MQRIDRGEGRLANPDPTKAREAKARKRLETTDPGDFLRLKGKLWALLDKIEETLAGTSRITPENVRIVYAFTQVAATFAKIHEIGELEERVAALEAASKGNRP